jgi:hypothetical protein
VPYQEIPRLELIETMWNSSMLNSLLRNYQRQRSGCAGRVSPQSPKAFRDSPTPPTSIYSKPHFTRGLPVFHSSRSNNFRARCYRRDKKMFVQASSVQAAFHQRVRQGGHYVVSRCYRIPWTISDRRPGVNEESSYPQCQQHMGVGWCCTERYVLCPHMDGGFY